MEFVFCSSVQFIGQTILKVIWDCIFETLKSMLWDIFYLWKSVVSEKNIEKKCSF